LALPVTKRMDRGEDDMVGGGGRGRRAALAGRELSQRVLVVLR